MQIIIKFILARSLELLTSSVKFSCEISGIDGDFYQDLISKNDCSA